MKIIENFITYLSRSKSYGFGVLESNVESYRGGFSQAAFEEKRQSTRVEISIPVWYQVKKSWSKWLLGKTVEHSGTGIRLALPPGVTPGTEIKMRMKLPNTAQSIDVKGVVVWVEPKSDRNVKRNTVECGVAFSNLRNVAHQERLVFLIADKVNDIGMHLTKDVVAGPVQSVDELKDCYRIVYDGYLARGYCLPNENKMHYHHYAFLSDSRTFCLKEKDKIIGTVSVLADSPCGLPMDTLFQREIDHLRGKGRKVVEVSLLSMPIVGKNKKFFSLTNLDKQMRLFRLFKIVINYAVHAIGATDLVIGVHPKHETLYKYLMFKAMGSAKSYSGACENPALPLHLDFLAAEQDCSCYLKSFFLSNPTPLEVMRGGLKVNAQIVEEFLCKDKKIWSKIPPASQKYLKQCYPGIMPQYKNFFSNL